MVPEFIFPFAASDDMISELSQLIRLTENLQEFDLSKRGLTSEASATLLEAFRESESVNNLDQLPELDKGIGASHEVVQEFVRLIEHSKSLISVDLRGMHLSESAIASLLTALIDSNSIKQLKHLPMLDKEVCSAARVVAVLP